MSTVRGGTENQSTLSDDALRYSGHFCLIVFTGIQQLCITVYVNVCYCAIWSYDHNIE